VMRYLAALHFELPAAFNLHGVKNIQNSKSAVQTSHFEGIENMKDDFEVDDI